MVEKTNNVDSAMAKLEFKGINRRKFIKYCSATAAVFGLDYYFGGLFAEAAAAAINKKPVIWIQGQGCTGCTTSVLSSLNPGPAEILLDLVSMRFNTTVMNSAGDIAADVLEETINSGDYLLVVEGSIPTADPRYCVIEGYNFDELLQKTAKNATAVVAVGTCAAYGGIPRAGETGARGVSEIITDIPVVNIPGCPLKPDWLMGVLLYYFNFNELPPLDGDGRPTAYFSNYLIHDNCPRVAFFERGQFLEDWNDPATVDWCLLKVGCKGPVTYADCNRIWWNDGANYCIRAGSPCSACVQPQFYEDIAPLYASPFVTGGESTIMSYFEDRQRGIDAGSAALGAGIVATPLLANKIIELLNKNKEGANEHGNQNNS